jgi:hypothetical protein
VSRELIRRPAREIIASFPGDVAVDLSKLHCETRFGIVSPGEPGYQPLYISPSAIERGAIDLAFLDESLIRQGRATRAPTDAEREAALIGSLAGWHVPGADPLNQGALED